MNYYEKNILFLDHHLKNKEVISQINASSIYPCVSTKSGHYSIQTPCGLLGSKYDPIKEAKRFVEGSNIKKNYSIIVYGIGSGYHLEPFLKKVGPLGKIILIELNLSILKTTLKWLNFDKLPNLNSLKIITGNTQNDILSKLQPLLDKNFNNQSLTQKKIIIHQPSLENIPSKSLWIKDILEQIQIEKQGDQAFAPTIIKNLKSNKDILFNSFIFRDIQNQFMNKPTVLIGSGPSLDQAYSFLKKIKNNAILVAIDSALIPLNKNNIRPDFVISIDPQNKSFLNFDGLEKMEIPLLALPSSNKKVILNTKCPKVFFIQKNSQVSCLFENKLDFIGTTQGGGAASVMASDLILSCTPSQLIYVGMDFSFPGLKSYANFSPELNQWMRHTTPLNSLESISIHNILSRKTVFIKNNDNQSVPTFQSMVSYLRSLEEVHKLYPLISIKNLSPYGALINGAPYMKYEETLNSLTRKIEKKFEFHLNSWSKDIKSFINSKLDRLELLE